MSLSDSLYDYYLRWVALHCSIVPMTVHACHIMVEPSQIVLGRYRTPHASLFWFTVYTWVWYYIEHPHEYGLVEIDILEV